MKRNLNVNDLNPLASQKYTHPFMDAQMAIPYRQIRAHYDDQTVTVYQAYSEDIAIPAVKAQRLGASPKFSHTRMTWIKPSWCWMMYRAGYGFKDARQARILAIRMSHDHFQELLSHASVTSSESKGPMSLEAKEKAVRVQWDPERDPKLNVLPYRSIQIGISGKLNETWSNEWIESIEDVTERAHELKEVIDTEPNIAFEDLVIRGLMPVEKDYQVPAAMRAVLEMDG